MSWESINVPRPESFRLPALETTAHVLNLYIFNNTSNSLTYFKRWLNCENYLWLSEFYQTQLPTFDSPESSSSGRIGQAEASQTSRCHALALFSGYGDDADPPYEVRRLFCRRIQAFDFIFRCQRFLVLNLTGMFRAWPFWKRRTTIPWKLKIKKMKKTCCYRNPIRKYFVRPGTSGVLDFFLIPHWTPGWWWEVHEFESLAKKRGAYL